MPLRRVECIVNYLRPSSHYWTVHVLKGISDFRWHWIDKVSDKQTNSWGFGFGSAMSTGPSIQYYTTTKLGKEANGSLFRLPKKALGCWRIDCHDCQCTVKTFDSSNYPFICRTSQRPKIDYRRLGRWAALNFNASLLENCGKDGMELQYIPF